MNHSNNFEYNTTVTRDGYGTVRRHACIWFQ